MHRTPSFEKWAIQKEGVLTIGGHFFIAGDSFAD